LLDNVRRRVLDDQLFAPQSIVRLTIQLQQRWIPPDHGVAGRAAGGVTIGTKRVLTWTGAREGNRPFAVDHAVLAERWASGGGAWLAAPVDRRVDRGVVRARPAVVRPIANRGHGEQIAGTRCADIGDEYAFCFVACDLFGLVVAQIGR